MTHIYCDIITLNELDKANDVHSFKCGLMKACAGTLSSEKKYMKVEVQFRTIAMDFWASLDHKLKYKKDNLKHPEIIVQELKKCADTITSVDYKMQEIRNMLED